MSFFAYKLVGSLAEPLNLIACLLLLAALAAFLPGDRAPRFARGIVLLLAIALFVPALVPVGSWALAPLENRYAPSEPKEVDGILLLTTSEKIAFSEARDFPVLDMAGQNYLTVARLAKKYPKAKIVIVGDPAAFFHSKKTSIQTVAREIMEGAGVPVSRLAFEPKSRTTYENALFAKKQIHPGKDETWLLVSFAHHLPRAYLCFEKQGWNVVPYPGLYLGPPRPGAFQFLEAAQQMRLLSYAAHEYVGLATYWLKGWIERPWR